MSKARLTVTVLGILGGAVVMATVIVPLNLAALRGVTGRDGDEPRRQFARWRQAPPPPVMPVPLPGAARRPAPPDTPAGVEDLFDALNVAVQGGDPQAIADHLDGARMAQELRRAGVLRGLPAGLDAQLAEGLRRGMAQALARNGPALALAGTEIRSVKPLAGGNEVAVVTRQRDNNNHSVAKLRWWLARWGDGWKVYDLEDLDSAVRVSAVVASMLPKGPGLPRIPPEWAATGPALQEAGQAIRGGDFAGAERALDRLKGARLPPSLEAVRLLVLAAAKVGQRQFHLARPLLDKARALNPDMPALDFLYGVVYNQTGRPGEALTHLKKYRDLLGDDPDLSLQLGVALSRLGRAAEAVPHLRQALDEDPGFVDALLELRRALPRGQKAELRRRYAALPQAHQFFEELALDALRDRDAEAVRLYAAVLRGQGLNDPVMDACEARAKAQAGQLEAAAALFKRAMDNMRDGQARKNYTREFVLDLVDAGQAVRAYALVPDRDEAFPLLAQELFNNRDTDALRELIAARRRDRPDDPWAHFYSGELLADAKEYDRADKEFAAAQAGMKDEPGRERVRWQRVWVRYRAGRWRAAYEEVGPRAATFNQLADLLAQARDGKRLGELLALQRAREPGDPNLPAWEAESAWLARDYASVVRLLRQHRAGVFAGQRWQFRFAPRLLHSLVKLGRLEEACKEVRALARNPAQRAGLNTAFTDLIRDRQDKAATAFAAARCAADPADPEGLVWQARADLLARRFALVGLLLRRALNHQPNENLRQNYLYEFLADAAQLREPLEGYRAAPDPDRAFRILADSLLGYARFVAPPDGDDDRDDFPEDEDFRAGGPAPAEARQDLRRLIAAHRAARPNDPAADLYLGALYRAEKDYAKAAEAYARGMARKPPDDLRQRFRYDQAETLYRSGKVVAAYAELGRDKQIFVQLANLCSQDRKGRELNELVAALRQANPNDADLPAWECEARYLMGDYAGALDLLLQHRAGAFALPANQWKYRDRLVRCLARLKRFDEAAKEAEASVKGRGGNLLLPAVVYALRGDVERTRAALAKCSRSFYNAVTFYADPDLGPALCSERFRELQRRYPEPLPLPASERKRFGRRF